MGETERELANSICKNPLDDNLRVQLENLLSNTEPDSPKLKLLRYERRIAETLADGNPVEELIHEYKQFLVVESTYFWDMRGCLNHFFRPFSLWCVFCDQRRFPALEIAIQNKLNRSISLAALPIELLCGNQLDAVYEIKNDIIEFVRRYRGPLGNEPDVTPDEIVIVMLASNSRKLQTRHNVQRGTNSS